MNGWEAVQDNLVMPKNHGFRQQALKPAAAALQAKFKQGMALHQQGKLAEAERIYGEVLRQQPDHFDALHLLGVIAGQTRRTERAIELLRKAIGLNASVSAAHSNLGNALQELQRLDEALASYDNALALKPDYAEAFNNRGNVLRELKRLNEALASYDKALVLKPDYAEAFNNRGLALQELKRLDEALASYDEALAVKPDYVEALNNRGNALKELKRFDEALASYDQALALKPDYAEALNNCGLALKELKRFDEALASYDKALALKPDYAEAFINRGNALKELKRFDEALASYDKALAVKPDYVEALNNRGNALKELKRFDEALASYDKALALKPDYAEALNNRGNALHGLKRFDEALASYDKALELKPDYAEAFYNRANALLELKRLDEALASYDRAIILKPDLAEVEGLRLYTKMRLCDWSNLDNECAHLISAVKSGHLNTPPFPLLAIPLSSNDQHKYAKLWIASKCPPSEKSIWQGERYNHDRIRVAYLSADFRQHPVSSLIVGVFECHDRSRFDVTAISFGPDDNSEMRERLKASFEHFIDASTYSDSQIANLVKEREIDILIDLMGFTADSRTSIFAWRPAPIQVNYLGYPGTMGAQYIDYIIADRIMIRENQHEFYSEKIVFLPNSFQPTDRKRRLADKIFTRAEVGLPLEGFVFCCFNTNYKITPDVYDIWMRILKQVDGSVLWLFAESPTVASRLKSEAATRRVNAERLIFAPLMSLPEHQARLRLADLFLDTLPYNAGTTASDTLWAGLPVLTHIGDTFAGRMAASILNAIHLPELITTTPEDYEVLAIDLAMHPDKLKEIKHKLDRNRLTTPLFDTKLFTKHIEAAYAIMYERHQAGLAPDHIVIPN
jgi:predicted O-linked N-acetylglucosamine transferase (SPINDLY family)